MNPHRNTDKDKREVERNTQRNKEKVWQTWEGRRQWRSSFLGMYLGKRRRAVGSRPRKNYENPPMHTEICSLQRLLICCGSRRIGSRHWVELSVGKTPGLALRVRWAHPLQLPQLLPPASSIQSLWLWAWWDQITLQPQPNTTSMKNWWASQASHSRENYEVSTGISIFQVKKLRLRKPIGLGQAHLVRDGATIWSKVCFFYQTTFQERK